MEEQVQKTEEAVQPVEESAPQPNLVQVLKEKIDRFVILVANYEGSKKQLQRVLASLAIHPFNEKPFQFNYPAEEELFNLGVEVASNKLIFLHLGIEEQRMAREIKERTDKQETKETTNG